MTLITSNSENHLFRELMALSLIIQLYITCRFSSSFFYSVQRVRTLSSGEADKVVTGFQAPPVLIQRTSTLENH